MINALSESIVNLKADSSVENKKNFVSKLISEKFFVPVIVEADEKTHTTKMGYYSIAAESGSYLLVFTSVEAIGAWRKDVQFLELGFKDVSSLINIEGAEYIGIEIYHSGNSMALKKDFINKIKEHINVKKKN